MTSIYLVNALASMLEKALDGYTFTDSFGDAKAVNVYKYYLPKLEPGEPEVTPYVCIRVMEGQDDYDGATVSVAVIVAIRDENRDTGYLSLANVMEHVRQAILQSTFITDGTRNFPYLKPVKWAIDNEPNDPIFMGYITITANVPTLVNSQELDF